MLTLTLFVQVDRAKESIIGGNRLNTVSTEDTDIS